MVTAIEEERDIAKLSLEELSGSLQAHEPKVLRSNEKPEEKAFYAKGNLRDVENLEDTYGRGRGGTMRGRGRNNSRGRGRGKFIGSKSFGGTFGNTSYKDNQGASSTDQFSQTFDQGSQFSDQRSTRGSLRNEQCYYCRRFGHVQSNYWFKNRNLEEGSSSNVDKNTSEKLGSLFMVHSAKETPESSI